MHVMVAVCYWCGACKVLVDRGCVAELLLRTVNTVLYSCSWLVVYGLFISLYSMMIVAIAHTTSRHITSTTTTTTGATTAPILRPSVVMLTVGMVTIVEDCDIVEALIGLVIMDSCIDVAVSVVAVVVMAIVVVVTSTAVGTVLIVRTVS